MTNPSLSEAERNYVDARVAEGESRNDVVARVLAERVGPGAPDQVPNVVPGGHIGAPNGQPPETPEGVCPTCGAPLDERPTGMTASEYDERVGSTGATVPELQTEAAEAAEDEPETQPDLGEEQPPAADDEDAYA